MIFARLKSRNYKCSGVSALCGAWGCGTCVYESWKVDQKRRVQSSMDRVLIHPLKNLTREKGIIKLLLGVSHRCGSWTYEWDWVF